MSQYLSRARRSAEIQTVRQADEHDQCIWVFCVWCGHSHITRPRHLTALVNDAPDILDALERRLTCSMCGRKGVKLIPTDRTMVSTERMGASVGLGFEGT